MKNTEVANLYYYMQLHAAKTSIEENRHCIQFYTPTVLTAVTWIEFVLQYVVLTALYTYCLPLHSIHTRYLVSNVVRQ